MQAVALELVSLDFSSTLKSVVVDKPPATCAAWSSKYWSATNKSTSSSLSPLTLDLWSKNAPSGLPTALFRSNHRRRPRCPWPWKSWSHKWLLVNRRKQRLQLELPWLASARTWIGPRNHLLRSWQALIKKVLLSWWIYSSSLSKLMISNNAAITSHRSCPIDESQQFTCDSRSTVIKPQKRLSFPTRSNSCLT